MSRRTIAPTLRRLVNGHGLDPCDGERRLRSEFRALLAVAREAERLSVLIEGSLKREEQVCGTEINLWHAVKNLRRASGAGGES